MCGGKVSPEQINGISELRNFNQSADNNKTPIFGRLRDVFTQPGAVLEIGSGSGQHAIFLAENMRWLAWQPTEQGELLGDLTANIEELATDNVLIPVRLEVGAIWPDGRYDYAYTANVLHIMSEELMPGFFAEVSERLEPGGICSVYGPFRYNGHFTTESNAHFDLFLKETYPHGGIRDFEVVCAEADRHGFELLHDFNMPANNQLLVFRLSTSAS